MLAARPDGEQIVQVLMADSIEGAFQSVTASVPGLRECERAVAEQRPSATSLSVAVSIDESKCGSSLHPGVIAGIVLGCMLLALALILLIVWLRNRSVKQFNQEANDRIREKHLEDLQRQKDAAVEL